MLELTAGHKNLLWCISYATVETFLLVSSNSRNAIASSMNNLYDQMTKTKLLLFLLLTNEDTDVFLKTSESSPSKAETAMSGKILQHLKLTDFRDSFFF